MTAPSSKVFFISHSTIDSRLHDCFVQLLTTGFGIHKDSVFSSSIARSIPTNDRFTDTIKENIRRCDVIFLLLTSSYMRSAFCLAELGAAWALDKHIVPIRIEPVTFTEYDRTPLQGRQCVHLHNLVNVFGELRDMGYISGGDLAGFNACHQKFTETLRYAEGSDNRFIATVVQDRADMFTGSNLQGKRCLRLDTLIPLSEKPADGETHWLFFDDDTERLGDPRVGDVIEFTVSGSKFYPTPWADGLSNTRNIYTNKKIRILNR